MTLSRFYNIDMRRVNDAGIVRDYYQNNVIGVFDLNYLSKHNFSDIPNVNLRKIVTRLIDQRYS